MKKIAAILLATILTFSLAACGGNNGNSGGSESGNGSGETEEPVAENALELLNTVWSSYVEDEKFPASGGDSSEENMSMEGPGKFSIEDAAMLDSTLGFPQASVGEIDDAASLMHMMNANNFTCGAFHVKDAGTMEDLTTAIKDNIMQRQWLCGFPEKLVIMTVGDYVLSFFGSGDIVDTFQGKVSAAYEGTQVVCDEPIA